MYLYEKEKDKINVYELKELKDKLFEYRRKEMEKLNKHSILYNFLSNDVHTMYSLMQCDLDEKKLITKENKFFIHKNGVKLENVYYLYDNQIIIDGLLYQFCNGYYNLSEKLVNLYNGDDVVKHFVLTNNNIDIRKRKLLKIDGEFYKYKLSNLINIPETIYLLQLLINEEFEKIYDKNIDELLALYDFQDIPVNSLDINTINFINYSYKLTDEELELNQNILKKVRQINK